MESKSENPPLSNLVPPAACSLKACWDAGWLDGIKPHMGKQDTSTNETEEGKRRKVMADKQEDKSGWRSNNTGWSRKGWRVSDTSPQPRSVYLKPRAAFCGLAPSLPTKPIRTSNGGKEKTVKCGLESEIKLVRIALTPTHHCSVQPLGNQEDVLNLHIFWAICILMLH